MQTDTHSRGALGYVALGGTLIAGGMAVIALVGWLLGLPELAGFRANSIPMAPGIALALLALSSAGFAAMRSPERRAARWMSRIVAMLVMLLGLLILVQPVFGLDIEHWLYPTPDLLMGVPRGRMSPLTAVAFTLAGASLLALVWRRPAYNVAAGLSVGTILIAAIVVIGYWYGTPLLYGGTLVPVALPTAVAFLALGTALLAMIGTHARILTALTGPSPRAHVLRAFLPIAVGFTLVEERMQQLLLDLLDFSRVGTRGRQFEPTDCEGVLAQAEGALGLEIEEAQAQITHDPLPIIAADRAQLVQLFSHLIFNALKFRSAEPPRVHISARETFEVSETSKVWGPARATFEVSQTSKVWGPARATFEVSQTSKVWGPARATFEVSETSRVWVFSVRDNGVGIDPEYHERIFGVFQRLNSRRVYQGKALAWRSARRSSSATAAAFGWSRRKARAQHSISRSRRCRGGWGFPFTDCDSGRFRLQ